MGLGRASPERGFTLGEVIVLVVIVVAISAIAIPGLMSSQRASNERSASAALKTLAAAEADFRTNDRDGNHVNDFWTGDVKGLYTMTRAEIPGAGIQKDDPPLRLIELSVARADADPTLVTAGGENMPLDTFGTAAARDGYWFAALLADLSAADPKDRAYRTDTGGEPPMGRCHHLSRFGFLAFPDAPSKGRYVFRVNEDNTVYRESPPAGMRKGSRIPPGLDAVTPGLLNWHPVAEQYYGPLR